MTARRWLRVALVGPLALLAGGCAVVALLAPIPTARDVRPEAAVVRQEGAVPELWVTFSTPTDLLRIRRTQAAYTAADVSRCQDGRFTDRLMVSMASLQTTIGGQSRRPFGGFDDLASNPVAELPPPDADGRFRYSFPIRLSNHWAFNRPSQNTPPWTFVPHDLTRDAMDLCFVIVAADMFGRYTSPPFVLPYALIADALARAGLPHAAAP